MKHKVYCTNTEHGVHEIGEIPSIQSADMDQQWFCSMCGAEKPLRRFCLFSEGAAKHFERTRERFQLFAATTLMLIIFAMVLLTAIFG